MTMSSSNSSRSLPEKIKYDRRLSSQSKASSEESVSTTMSDATPSCDGSMHDKSDFPSRPCPYLSTMLGRKRSLRRLWSKEKSGLGVRVRRGSLFEKLRQRGVPEDIACRRQHIYNRLMTVVSVCCYDDDDNC